MSAKQFTRMVASPVRAMALKSPSSPKSILKRPSPLPLAPSPFPFDGPESAHVHFPPSAQLTSLFPAHSPGTYDRGAIAVSPNPLELPSWGERVYSPSTGGFRGSDVMSKSSPLSSPAFNVTTFDEPAIITMPPKAKTRAGATFRERVASQLTPPTPSRGPTDLGKSLLHFPRSPYPSAPASPLVQTLTQEQDSENAENAGDITTRAQRSSTVYGDSPIRVSSEGVGKASKRARVSQLSLNQDFRTSVTRITLEEPGLESPLDQAFWNAISLEDCATPASAVPQFLFGTKDGQLWSPGLPRNKNDTRQSDFMNVLSPSVGSSFGRSIVTAPSPSDPFAAFPSFTAVLSLAGETVAYPPPALVEPAENESLTGVE